MAFCLDLDHNCWCEYLWWCGSFGIFMQALSLACSCFAAVYYIAAWVVFPTVEKRLKAFPSKYPNEETKHWFASHVQSALHALVMIYMAILPTMKLISAEPDVKFARPEGKLCPSEVVARGSLGNASMIFAAHLLVDFMTGIIHGHADGTIIVHHLLFITFVLIVFYNCFGLYLGGVFLTMETSTLFLDYYSFFRNRLGYKHWSVKLSFLMFVTIFVFFRIIGCAAVGFEFFLAVYNGQVSTLVPWHLYFVSAGIVGALVLNTLWSGGIVGNARKVFFFTMINANAAVESPSAESYKKDF